MDESKYYHPSKNPWIVAQSLSIYLHNNLKQFFSYKHLISVLLRVNKY